MASNKAVADALDLLSGANPQAFVRPTTPMAYAEILRDVDDSALRAASLQEWAKFPSAHELRRAALAVQAPHYDLGGELQQAYDKFFETGEYDPAEFEHIANLFENAGQGHMAEYAREMLRRIQLIEAAEAVPA